MAKEIDNQTLAVTTLFASPFAICQTHRVRLPSGAIVSDWLYFEERHTSTCLCEPKMTISLWSSSSQSMPPDRRLRRWVVTWKMANRLLLPPGGSSWRSWVSGHPSCVRLGRSSTSANRGSGRVYAFFADACHEPAVKQDLNRPKHRRADLEAQHVERLTREQLLDALVASQFVEVKWTATISLALLTIPE